MPIIDLKLKQKLFSNYYSMLNSKQQEAVFAPEGPVLVIAGAGSGKTTVLVNRIAYLIHFGNAYYANKEVEVSYEELQMLQLLSENPTSFPRDAYLPILKSFAENPCPPDRILAITFTNKAADEIKSRLAFYVGDDADQIWAGTFHSICVRLLRRFCDFTEYGRDFIIYDTNDCKKIISDIIKELEIDNEEITPKYLMNLISRAKNSLQTPEEFEKRNNRTEKRRVCSQIYTMYQKRLTEALAMDFDDLIMQTVLLLQNSSEVLTWCQRKFRCILVDEYQDTNYTQYLLMKLIAGDRANVTVVGDDDQSIYKFRGAAVENILSFDREFKNTNVIFLEQNYRSTRHIIDAANALIANNESRRGKTLWCDNAIGRKVAVHQLANQEKEAVFVAEEINQFAMLKTARYRDIAVLYRTKAQSGILENVFTKSGLPHRLLSGIRFYDHAEVKDILAYLRLLYNKNDFISFSRVVNVPRRGIGQATVDKIRELSTTLNLPFYQVLSEAQDHPEIKRSFAKLNEFYQLIEHLTLFSFEHSPSQTIREIIERSGYMQTLSGDENEERRKNVEELLSTAVRYEEKNGEESSLAGFLEEIALVSDVDNYDKSSDAVVLMTVHAAKGLEFPIVFLVGMEENLFPSPQSCATKEDLEEERRLAYVAMTRAKKELYITAANERMVYGKTNRNDISRFIREIPEDLIDFHLYTPEKHHDHLFGGTKIYSVQSFDSRPSSDKTFAPTFRQKPQKKEVRERFYEGDKVSHAIFGNGIILEAKVYGADILYHIDFEKAGQKKLMATYAKLKKIQ